MIVGGERAKRESRVTGGSGMVLDILDNLVNRASLSLDLSEVRALTPPGSGESAFCEEEQPVEKSEGRASLLGSDLQISVQQVGHLDRFQGLLSEPISS